MALATALPGLRLHGCGGGRDHYLQVVPRIPDTSELLQCVFDSRTLLGGRPHIVEPPCIRYQSETAASRADVDSATLQGRSQDWHDDGHVTGPPVQHELDAG